MQGCSGIDRGHAETTEPNDGALYRLTSEGTLMQSRPATGRPPAPRPELVMPRGLFIVTLVLAGHPPSAAAEADYARDIKPLLRAKCYACHGAVRQKAGLRLDAGQLVLKGGKSGRGRRSREAGRIAARRDDHRPRRRARPHMPPEGEGEALSEKDVALFREWVKNGAKAPDRTGSRRPAIALGLPAAAKDEGARPRQPHRRVPRRRAREAETRRRTPRPTSRYSFAASTSTSSASRRRPTNCTRFLSDASPDAYEKVVDRLLASPMYGERWGRHWMDVWRYSDPVRQRRRVPLQPAAHLALARLDRRVAQRGQGLRPDDRGDARGRRDRPGRPRHAPRHRVPRPQLVQVQPQRVDAGHGRVHRRRVPRHHAALRPLPRPQVRPDLAGRLLPLPRVLRAARRPHRHRCPASRT